MKKLLFAFLFLTSTVGATTRFYFPSTGTAPVTPQFTPAASTGWDDTSGTAARYPLFTYRDGSASTNLTETTNAAFPEFLLLGQWVSEPLAAQTLSGTLKGQFRGQESNGGMNATLAILVKVVNSTGETVVGYPLTVSASDNTAATPPEFVVSPTAFTNRQVQDASENTSLTLTSVDIPQGGYLVIEVGVRDNTSNTTRTASVNVGGYDEVDLAEDNTTTTANIPWVEFSHDFVFACDPGDHYPTVDAGQFTNPDSVQWPDNARAQEGTVNDTMVAYNFTLNPDTSGGRPIAGISVKVSALCRENPLVGGGTTGTLDVRLSWDGGTTWTTAKSNVWTDGEAEARRTYGGTSDTWGRTWSYGDFTNVNFRVGLKYSAEDFANDQIDVDDIAVVLTCGNAPDVPSQPAPSCNANRGDTLYPVGAGFATGLSETHVDSTNWQLVNDVPGSSGCTSTAGADTVYGDVNTDATDYYKLGCATGTAPGTQNRWGQRVSDGGSVNRIVDCISVTACVHRAPSTGTDLIEVVLGLRDSAGNEVWGPRQSIATNGDQTVTAYFPNQNSTGGVWGNARWDSVSMLGLEAMIRMRRTDNNPVRQAVCKNLYALVYARDRDTSLVDSTNSDMQVLACSTATSLIMHRPSGAYMSRLNNNKVWFGCIIDAATDGWMMTGSNDTGRTWYWLSTTSDGNNTDDFGANIPDTVTLRTGNEGLQLSGAMLFGSADSTRGNGVGHPFTTDTFQVASLEYNGLDSAIIFQTKQRQQILSELTARKDTLSPGGAGNTGRVALQFPIFYTLGDTLWMFGGTATTNSLLRCYRSTDRGVSWFDSSYITGPGTDRNEDTDTINTVSSTRRLIAVRWSNGYPAIFTCGWTTPSASIIRFQRWHPTLSKLAADSGNIGAGRMWLDSLRNLAWLREPNTTTCDTARVQTATLINNGEMVAASTYSLSDTVAHVAWLATPRIMHATVTKALAVTIDTVAEINNNTLNQSHFFSMVSHEMSNIYLFWNYWRVAASVPSTGTDSSYIFFSRVCPTNKNRWWGPRPLSWFRGAGVVMKYPTTSQYQYGNMVVGLYGFASRGTNTHNNVLANRIVKGSNPAAGGAQPPSRRRRLIIEKNYKHGEVNEKDTTVNWAGYRLPDYTEEK